jgi:glutamate--cysteine ligase
VDAVVDLLHGHLKPLVEVAWGEGVGLWCRGLDPKNPVEGAVQYVESERYARQAAHYDRRGFWGRRMMLQTAAIHVNVDFGSDPGAVWRVANAAAPVWTAMFANSPVLEGRPSEHRSARAAQWRRLDSTRTGLFSTTSDPGAAYLDFALAADSFLEGAAGSPCAPFSVWLERGADRRAWHRHLTTLFPEVRPRGYLELRSFDALQPRWYAAPLTLVVGLLYDPEAREGARILLPEPTPELLEVAGREGLRNPGLARTALDLAELALEGAGRLGGVVGGRSLEVARAFVDTLTRRGLDPGDEPGDMVEEISPGA